MTDRTISVRLKAEVNDFRRQIGTATTSLDQLVKKSGDSSGAAATTMGRLAQSARLQSDAWREAGAGLAVVGAAITGVTVAVAKTGVEYNTLQQKSRAALSTLLGGAEAANAQMDKLDDFARTSPFSKAVFIQAQQQMIGFGIETAKVIPYLSAINEAIAATGGNNNDLSEIVRIFAQIQAAGKITATDLMQFGQRGVDAASMIGSQMGKTGAQIRDDISAGTLDAGQALDSLAAGMQERFAGASAGVKETMEGAFDRVKAAWRDLSAGLMEGAVGAEGGGWLVDLTNQTADLLRWIDKLPEPAKNAAGALGALTGAGALAAGGFIMLVPQIASTVTAVRTLSATFPLLTAAAGPAAAALVLVAGVAATIASDMATYSAEVEAYAAALALPSEEADKAARKLAAEALAAGGVADAMSRLGREATLATDAAMGSGEARRGLIEAYDREIAKLRELADAEANRGNYSSQAAADADRMIADRDAVLTLIDREIEKRGKSAETLAAETELIGENADAAESAATILADYSAETEEAAAAHEAWLASLADADAAFIDLKFGLDDAEYSLQKYMDTLREQVAAQQNWETNMVLLASRASEGMIAALAELGPEGAVLVADLVDATDAELADMEVLFAERGDAATNAFAEELDRAPAVWSALMAVAGRSAVDAAKAEVAAGKSTLQGIISRYNLSFLIDANTSPADRAVNLLIARINARTATLDIQTRVLNRNGLDAPLASGGYGADAASAVGLASGGQARRSFSQGALLEGPGTTTSDSIAAWLSRREFVTRAAAVDYYGPDVMYAMNAKRIPREVFKPFGYADGGSPGHAYQPARLAGGGMATLSASVDSAVIADAVAAGLAGARFYLDGRSIDARIELAQSRTARQIRRG